MPTCYNEQTNPSQIHRIRALTASPTAFDKSSSSSSSSSATSAYEPLQVIGTGGFGKIVCVRRKADQKEYVWKELHYGKMNKKDRANVVTEVNILRSLRPHPHIVRYYDRIVDKKSSKLFIVMEYCRGGDLASLIRRHRAEKCYIAEDFVWKMLAQITSAVKQCHRMNILHRDIKPANILLDLKLNAKICDFGLIHSSNEAQPTGMSMGTPCYMSPERVNNFKYDERSDIWSIGCIIYELCALSPPFEAPDHSTLASVINSGVIAPLPMHYSEELHHTVAWLLRHDVTRRPRVDEIEALPCLQLYLREIKCSMREMSYREKKHKLLMGVTKKEEIVKKREEKMLSEVANTHSRLRAYARKLLKWEQELMAQAKSLGTHQVLDSDTDEIDFIDFDKDDSSLSLSLPSSDQSLPDIVDSICESQQEVRDDSPIPMDMGDVKPPIRSMLLREISYETLPSHSNDRKRLMNDGNGTLIVSLSNEEEAMSPVRRKRAKV